MLLQKKNMLFQACAFHQFRFHSISTKDKKIIRELYVQNAFDTSESSFNLVCLQRSFMHVSCNPKEIHRQLSSLSRVPLLCFSFLGFFQVAVPSHRRPQN